MNENIIKPVWFDDWFNRKFPQSSIDFTPKELAFAFGVSKRAIYSKIKSCEIEHIKNGSSLNSPVIIPRQAVYNFALSCYCLNK